MRHRNFEAMTKQKSFRIGLPLLPGLSFELGRHNDHERILRSLAAINEHVGSLFGLSLELSTLKIDTFAH